MPGLEIWGGIECSIVRIGSATRNQLVDTGHITRRDDIARVAELGLKTLRYPVLWEMVEERRGCYDWRWTDERLGDLRAQGISPIAGLIHHGSGPAWTDLLDPEFPDALARYAEQVAARYPWIEMFTPVNEPLTTARISGLYGVWQPHVFDEGVCFRITVAECLGIARAMKAIRRITPRAKLVQTEDFGRIYSTADLAPQADYENERRWLAVDLLAGRVTKGHNFYEHLLRAGVDARLLAGLADDPCPPDMIGIDYYLTSDRMLDDRLALHPQEPAGGNGRQAYVDIAAVRSDVPTQKLGLCSRIGEVWERYHLPIGVTELHNGCSREEHVRWLMDGWHEAQKARAKGIDVRAITSWSLFGARDWNSMMTRFDGHHECGAFDTRYDPPEPTIVAQAISCLARNGEFDHPVLDRAGWWRTEAEPRPEARALLVKGFNRVTTAIGAACVNRRLSVVGSASLEGQKFPEKIWAAIMVRRRSLESGSSNGPLQLHCIYPDGETLTLDMPHDWHGVIDTFLDLVVDHRAGHFRFINQAQSIAHNAMVEPIAQAGHARVSGAA